MSKINPNKITVEHLVALEKKPSIDTVATILGEVTGKNVYSLSIVEYVSLMSEFQAVVQEVLSTQVGRDFAAILTRKQGEA